MAGFVGAFSARARQIGRNIERYEMAWRDTHPGQEPGPDLLRAWDRRAWPEARGPRQRNRRWDLASALRLFKHGIFRGREYTIKPSEDDERQDRRPILAGLPQLVGIFGLC